MGDYTAREAYDAWTAGEVAIVDCREETEHAMTRVPGVPLVPMSEIVDRVDDLPDDRPLVMLCRSGSRSAQVADWLVANGERDEVANLDGGIIAWAVEGLPYEGATPT